MTDMQKGQQITSAFQYIQQVFKECQLLMFKIDEELKPKWVHPHSTAITKGMSKSLKNPDKWLVEMIYRNYHNKEDKHVNKCITITFWGDEVEQPIIIVGKIVYSNINERDYWDLYKIWFNWSEPDKENTYQLDGEINIFRSTECEINKECMDIIEAKVFSLPLVSITDEDVLINKIINPLKEL